MKQLGQKPVYRLISNDKSVQNKQQISVSLNIDTSSDINPKLDALSEHLRYVHLLHGKTLTLDLETGWSHSVFVPAVPLSTVVTHILAASDGQPFYRTIALLLAVALGRLVLQLVLSR